MVMAEPKSKGYVGVKQLYRRWGMASEQREQQVQRPRPGVVRRDS